MPRKTTLPANEQAAVQANSDDLVALRCDAERYRWLRERALRINGGEVWGRGRFWICVATRA